MCREYSEKEMQEILKRDVKIPDKVEKKIQDAYRRIGIENVTPVRRRKAVRMWKAVAAVAVLTIGTSAVVVAANHFLSARRVENGESVVYEIAVDREKEAHAVEVEPTYLPEGYVYQEDGPFGGKYRNEETGSTLTIVAYNASELDYMERIGQGMGFDGYKKDTKLEEFTVDGQKLDVYTGEDSYIDSDNTVKQLYLFNEEYGYGIWISNRSSLPADELVKVVKGLEVNVLDEIVPYATEAEVEQERTGMETAMEEYEAWAGRIIPDEYIHEIGEEVKSPLYDHEYNEDKIRFTVKSAEFRDAISLEEFPEENFGLYFEQEILPWLNEDGTLKPYERMTSNHDEIETIQRKFLVVEMNVKNIGDQSSEFSTEEGISIAPDLTALVPDADGAYHPRGIFYHSASEQFMPQYGSNDGSSFPIYFDKRYFTDGVKGIKSGLFRPVAPGESLDYTLIYPVDEDQMENACLWFGSGALETAEETYIWVGENAAK